MRSKQTWRARAGSLNTCSASASSGWLVAHCTTPPTCSACPAPMRQSAPLPHRVQCDHKGIEVWLKEQRQGEAVLAGSVDHAVQRAAAAGWRDGGLDGCSTHELFTTTMFTGNQLNPPGPQAGPGEAPVCPPVGAEVGWVGCCTRVQSNQVAAVTFKWQEWCRLGGMAGQTKYTGKQRACTACRRCSR